MTPSLLWVRHFDAVEELHQAPLAFRDTHNTIWLTERHEIKRDVDLLAAAEVLHERQQWTRSRAVMIEMGLIQPGRHKAELEWSVSPTSLAFEEIDTDRTAPSHASVGDGSAAD